MWSTRLIRNKSQQLLSLSPSSEIVSGQSKGGRPAEGLRTQKQHQAVLHLCSPLCFLVSFLGNCQACPTPSRARLLAALPLWTLVRGWSLASREAGRNWD